MFARCSEGRATARVRAGDVIGPWTVLKRLGDGGNADVWRSTDAAGREVALKIIREESARAEPYKRFIREIQFLQGLKGSDGILDLVAAHLPDRPTAEDRPWLAMPVATLMPDALKDEGLVAAVDAIAAVARTIARLHAAGVSHRDIKPNNLYRHLDRWLIGDFGLVAVPDVEEPTKSGKSMGPVHFMAYEMLIDASSADPQAADVYSIGKTLWALTTQVPFPPLGHQGANSRGHAIADYRYHPNAGALDQLIDRCTRDDPKDRPSMAQVADELETWPKLTSDMPAIDVGVFRGPLRAALATELRDEDQTQERKELAYISVRRLTDLFGPINAALRQLHPKAEIDGQADEFGRNVVRTLATADAPEIVFRHQRLSQIKAGSIHNPYALRVTRSLELTADGQLILRLCILVAPTRTMGSDFMWMPEAWTGQVGSVQVEEMLRDAIHQAGEQMVAAVRIFTERLAARG